MAVIWISQTAFPFAEDDLPEVKALGKARN
jgi:hypothetical protein